MLAVVTEGVFDTMGKVETRYVAKLEAGQGWYVWDRETKG